MDEAELQEIERRLKDGECDADAQTMRALRRLIDEVRRLRAETALPQSARVH